MLLVKLAGERIGIMSGYSIFKHAGLMIASMIVVQSACAFGAEQSASENPAPEPLERARKIVMQKLKPVIDGSYKEGYFGELLRVAPSGDPLAWFTSKPRSTKGVPPFLTALNTIVKYAACDAHPAGLKYLFDVSKIMPIPFVMHNQRLFLQWRASSVGLQLPFYEERAKRLSLPEFTVAAPWPSPAPNKSKQAYKRAFGDDVDMGRISKDLDELTWINNLLYDNLFDEVIATMSPFDLLCDVQPRRPWRF